MVDTIGFGHTVVNSPVQGRPKNDFAAIIELVAALENRSKKGLKVSGIIYIHNITDQRVNSVGVEGLNILDTVFGDSTMRNVCFLTTQWGGRESQEFVDRETTLKQEFVEKVVRGSANATFKRLDDGTGDPLTQALEVIEPMIGNPLEEDGQTIAALVEGTPLVDTPWGKAQVDKMEERIMQYKALGDHGRAQEWQQDLEGFKQMSFYKQCRNLGGALLAPVGLASVGKFLGSMAGIPLEAVGRTTTAIGGLGGRSRDQGGQGQDSRVALPARAGQVHEIPVEVGGRTTIR
ncbi:hypothetical protein BDN72DRAFT_903187 [Pluteus cervinus]|uniref:Uncharacterized protein n=1 Tax=Pluteus cervinus TaxID=181527 RepID=A0ACD3ACA1_9AGAR|nr:hypothetical protein BDN72DRAFT_903187 [Pluteus cervinus]